MEGVSMGGCPMGGYLIRGYPVGRYPISGYPIGSYATGGHFLRDGIKVNTTVGKYLGNGQSVMTESWHVIPHDP